MEETDTRIAAHDSPEGASGSNQVYRRVVKEGDWGDVLVEREGELRRGKEGMQ